MKKSVSAVLAWFFMIACALPAPARAQGAAPALFDVQEVIVQYARFPDPKAANTCGLSREQIADTLAKALAGTRVPATPVADAKPPELGVARIDLVPEIYAYTDDSLNCVSAVSLSAENRVNALIPPVNTLRGITVVYWQQRTIAASNQTNHAQVIANLLQKMATNFAQEYRIDQPPALPK